MPRFSAHLGYLFAERPLAERFAAARAAGFAAVEHPAPYAIPALQMRRLLADNRLRLVQLALPAGRPGEKGCTALPGREAEFRTSLQTALAYARAIDAPFVQVQSGLVTPGADKAAMWDTYLRNLDAACRAAEEVGLGVLIEPIGVATIADYFMDRPALAVEALQQVERPNLHMLFDAFHAAAGGVDPVAFLARHAGSVGHIHIADYPGRHQPGTGTLDFAALFTAAERAGYAGWFGCEYQPDGTTEDSLRWFAPFREPASP